MFNSKSTLYKIISCLCFASINGLIKAIDLPIAEITCLQNLFGALFLMPWIFRDQFMWRSLFLDKSILSFNGILLFIRSALAIGGVLLWVYSIKHLPLFQTIAMGFLGPFFTTLGARFFLNETITSYKSLAIVLALIGGVCVNYKTSLLSSTFGSTIWIAPIAATAAFSCVAIMNKSLLRSIDPLVLGFFLFSMTGITLLISFHLWIGPSFLQMGQLAFLGALTAGAHMFMYKAISQSDVTSLIPLGVTRVIASAFIGWLFFQERPTDWMWLGILIIIGAWALLIKDQLKKEIAIEKSF